MLKAEVYEEVVKPEMDKINREKAINEALPTVYASVENHILKLVQDTDAKLGALITADGKPSMTAENLDKMSKASPIASAQLSLAAAELSPIIMALEMTQVAASGYRLNPAADPVHAKIANYVRQAEHEMLQAPSDVRIQDGKEFATLTQMQQMRSSIEQSNATAEVKRQQLAALNERYYTLSVDEIEAFIVSDFAEQARIRIEKERELAKREFGTPIGNGQHQGSAAATAPVADAGQQPSNKPRPPSTTSGHDTVRHDDQQQGGQKKFGEIMAETYYGKK